MSVVGIRRLLRDDRGASAAEFGMIAPVFLALIFGAVHASMLGYSAASLHFAVEDAARCRAMGTTCSDATTTQNYALARFHKIAGQSPTFVITDPTGTPRCAQVTGNLDYNFNWVLSSQTVPLSATACFPS